MGKGHEEARTRSDRLAGLQRRRCPRRRHQFRRVFFWATPSGLTPNTSAPQAHGLDSASRTPGAALVVIALHLALAYDPNDGNGCVWSVSITPRHKCDLWKTMRGKTTAHLPHVEFALHHGTVGAATGLAPTEVHKKKCLPRLLIMGSRP